MRARRAWMEALDLVTWLDVDRGLEAITDLPRSTLADQVFAETCAARVAWLRPKLIEAPELDPLRWKAAETGDRALQAFALLPFEDYSEPTLSVGRARRAWALVQDLQDDPVALLAAFNVASVSITWRVDGSRSEAIGAMLWAARQDWRAIGVCGALLHVRVALAANDRDGVRRWCAQALELAGPSHGQLVALVYSAISEITWLDGDREGALAAAAAMAVRNPGGANSGYYDLLRSVGRVEEAIPGLEAAFRDSNNWLASLRLALAYLSCGEIDRARAVLEADTSPKPPLGQHYLLLLRAATGLTPVTSALEVTTVAARLRPEPDTLLILEHIVARAPRGSAVEARLQIARDQLARMLGRHVTQPVGAGPVVVGPFDLGGRIGSGANARVFAAHHHQTGASVALKVLAGSSVRGDLEDEARILARMRHPNVLSVLELGVVSPEEAARSRGLLHEGAAWMAMERITGGTLADRVGDLPSAALGPLVEALLLGLAHAHGAGMLHLDLKPANILLRRSKTEVTPLLADFGVYSLMRRTARGRIAGTPAYMAPEQWRGALDGLSPATDLYALGAIVVELLLRRRAFPGPTVEDFRAQHLATARPRLDVAPPVQQWLDRMLAISPGDRYPSAAEALEAFGRLPPIAASRANEVWPADARAQATLATELLSEDLDLPSDPPHVAVRDPARPVPPLARVALPPISPLVPPVLALEASDCGLLPGLQRFQDALWSAVREASASDPREVRLHGPAAGALTGWLARSAREAGLQVTQPGPGDLGVGAGFVLTREPDPARATMSLPLLPRAELERALLDRLPVELALCRDIAERAAGDLDVALDILVGAASTLQRVGAGWSTSDPAAVLRRGDAVFAARAHELCVRQPDRARELLVAFLADAPVDEDRALPGFVDAAGRVIPALGAILEARLPLRPAELEHALTRAATASARARVLQRLGRVTEAMDLLLDQSDEDLNNTSYTAMGFHLRQAAELPCDLPARYFLLRGRHLWVAEGNREGAIHSLERAARDPEFGPRARHALALAYGEPGHLDSEDPLRVAEALTARASAAYFRGDREEADELASRAVAVAPPHHVWAEAFQLWWSLSERRDPDWVDRFLALLDRAPPEHKNRLQTLLAAGEVMWGELDRAADRVAPLDDEVALTTQLLLAVARDEHVRLSQMVFGPMQGRLSHQTWFWTVHWWLDADGPDDRWEALVQRWPARIGVPVAAWVLGRAAGRAPPGRREQILAARDLSRPRNPVRPG